MSQAGVCERCAGEKVRQVCRGCGVEETNYLAGRCARCVLRERVGELARSGDPVVVAALKGYLDALVENPKPLSVLRWMSKSRGFQTLLELLTGARALTHEALDGVDRGQSTIFLRSALIRHGALGERHGQSAALAAFINREVLRVPDDPGRLTLRMFATWKVQHELARAERQGRVKRTAEHYARTLIRVAADLLAWLSQHDMTLDDLRQEHLDHWLAEGSSQHARIRIFIAWAARHGITQRLIVPAPATRRHVDPLDPHKRLRLIRRLLDDESLDLGDRVAGCLVLLFAQPISRLVLLTKDDIQGHHGRLFISLGREPLLLPKPLAILVGRLKERQAGPASTGVKLDSRWLFPGLRLDTAIHEEAMRRRLRKLGITGRAARNAAALQLAKTMPAAILADLLGVHESTAEDWTQLAAGDWARYAAAR
jgi:dsDNA-binding SOS-regulon protein